MIARMSIYFNTALVLAFLIGSAAAEEHRETMTIRAVVVDAVDTTYPPVAEALAEIEPAAGCETVAVTDDHEVILCETIYE